MIGRLTHGEWCRHLHGLRLLATEHRRCRFGERCVAIVHGQPWRYQRRRSSLPERGAVPHLPSGVTVNGASWQ